MSGPREQTMPEHAEPTAEDVARLARRIHRCPAGYTGECYGPTLEDEGLARYRLQVVLNCPTPTNHGADSPFRYCPGCAWTEAWGQFEPVGEGR